MLARDEIPRPIWRITEEIAQHWLRIPPDLRQHLTGLASLDRVADKATYRAVAELRCKLNSWRAVAARPLKSELEIILAHYRAAHDD